MDLFSWLKIGNLIKNLNLSEWFKEWFSRTNKININKLYIYLNLPTENKPIVEFSNDGKQPILHKQVKVQFTNEQMELINNINKVHKISGRSNYDFQQDYKWALYYIQYKPASDWPYNAALRIAQAMQDIDFFSAFEEIKDPKKQEIFNDIKSKLNYIYRMIQELRDTNKRNQIEKQFKAPYHNILQKEPELKDSDYEDIFNEFQNLLIELFSKFNLKQK